MKQKDEWIMEGVVRIGQGSTDVGMRRVVMCGFESCTESGKGVGRATQDGSVRIQVWGTVTFGSRIGNFAPDLRMAISEFSVF